MSRRRMIILAATVLLGIFLVLMILPQIITPTFSGQKLVVNTLTDTDDGACDALHCSLREAIASASWGATITFSPGLTGTILLNEKPNDPLHNRLHITKSVRIDGPGPKSSAITLDGDNAHSIIYVVGNREHTVSLSLSYLTLANGKSTSGGAIINSGGTVTIANSTFLNNRTNTPTGGTIINFQGPLTITNSTFQGNRGGAISNNAGTVTISNSTFYDNDFAIDQSSGAITITNSTFHANPGNTILNEISTVGGTRDPRKSTVSLKNTIISGSADRANCFSPVIGLGHNLQFPQRDCGAGFLMGDPKLGPLQDNGGATFTLLPQPGSAALGKVPATDCPDKDQRGIAVRKGSPCNIGAVQ